MGELGEAGQGMKELGEGLKFSLSFCLFVFCFGIVVTLSYTHI